MDVILRDNTVSPWALKEARALVAEVQRVQPEQRVCWALLLLRDFSLAVRREQAWVPRGGLFCQLCLGELPD